MNFKKIVIAVVTALVILISPLTFQSVKAEEFSLNEHEAILLYGYDAVLEFYNQGGVISQDNCDTLYNSTGEAVKSAEIIKSQVTQQEYNDLYRNMFIDVFRVFKNTAIYKVENSYDESLYSPTENGIVAVNKQLVEVKGLISSANTYQAVVDAEQSFYEFIAYEPSKKVSDISTDESQPISVKAFSTSAIFAESDVIETEFFIDSVIIKNTKVALIDNPNLLDATNGVACFFSIKWVRDGVILDVSDVDVAPTFICVNVEDLGLELNDESCLQIVRYLGRGEVEFIDGAYLYDGNIVITLSEIVDTEYQLDFAVVAKGYAIEYSSILEQYVYEWGLDGLFTSIAESLSGISQDFVIDTSLVIGAVALLILPLALSILYFIYRLIVRIIKRKNKKKYKEYKREYGAFKKYKKRLKNEEKDRKKQKRLNKKQRRLEKKLRRKNKNID